VNAAEATDLLTILAAAEGRSEVNPAQAISWSFALDDIPADVAQAALREAFHAGETYRVTPQSIRKHAAPLMRRLAANVRSARIRGLVPPDWPETRPLPDAVRDRLAQEWEATNDAGELAAGTPKRREIAQ
jgi:hypothetical protein